MTTISIAWAFFLFYLLRFLAKAIAVAVKVTLEQDLLNAIAAGLTFVILMVFPIPQL